MSAPDVNANNNPLLPLSIFMTTLALYLHVPFCRQMCTYCHFNTFAGLEHLYEPYSKALAREIELMGGHRKQPTLHSIFLGGGTPTVLSIAQLSHIFAAVQQAFVVAPDAEITIEANPVTLDAAYLYGLRELGVNRLSFGAQSFNATELHLMNRDHDVAAIFRTVALARQAGFHNLSFDLIFGLPTQTLSAWRHTLEQAIALGTENISLYGLTLERGTAMRAQVVRGDLPEPDPDLGADMYELTESMLAEAGLQQYEISNWARPGFESRHNLTYWRNQPYLGCGPGAHSFEAGRRWWNLRPVPRYLQTLAALAEETAHPHPSLDAEETIDQRLEMGETMMMGLRLTREGVHRADFAARFGQSLESVFGSEIVRLKQLGLLSETDQRLLLTPQGRLLGNQVFLAFLPD